MKMFGGGEDRLNLVLQATRVGLWDWNVKTGEAAFSERWAEMTGYTLDELAPVSVETWTKLVCPDDLKRSEELLRKHFCGELPYYDCEFRMRHKDGHWIWVLNRGMVVERSEDGSPLRMTGTHADITDRKQIEGELRYQATLLSSLLDSIPDIVFFKDRNGVYLGCNPPFAEFAGSSRDRIVGKTDYDLFEKEVADSFRSYDRKVMEGNQARHNEETIRYPDGRMKQIDTFKAPLIVPDGRVIGLLGISRDITERKQTEDELSRRESYLSAIIENLPGLVWLKDADSCFLAVNQAFSTSCGFKQKSELEGKTDLDIWPEDLAKLYREDDLKVMKAMEPTVTEELIADQGERHWHETFKTPVMNDGGEVIGTVGYAQDITERKESRGKIERLNVIQSELVRLATGFVNISLSRRDEAINEALKTIGGLIEACRAYLFDYDFESQSMSNTYEWCAQGVSPEIDNLQNVPMELVPEWVAAHRRGREMLVEDVRVLEPDSALRKILEPQGIHSLITLPLMRDDECMGFVGFDAVKEPRAWGEDEIRLLHVLAEMLANFEIKRRATLALEKVNRELREARDKAEAGAKAKSMFLANMSHEIRTPLNAVLGHAQIMQRNAQTCPLDHCPKNCTGSLDAIARSGEHLLELINDILALIETDDREVRLLPSKFDFFELLEAIKIIYSQKVPDAVTLQVEPRADCPQMLEGDKGKIRQVLINLIGNALKFTEKGAVTASVYVFSAGQGALTICVDVSDTGAGIEKEALETIFNPFEQSDSGKKLKSGTGLGLPLCRRYARAMGGDVALLKSEVGKGSTFRFTFKATPVDFPGNQQSGAVERVDVSLKQAPRLLVVDDDASNLKMLSLMLSYAGFSVDTATSGPQALAWIESDSPTPDLILLDKRMPQMDGLETLCRLRKTPAGRDLPVIMVTASGLKDEQDAVISAGASGYLPKPVNREQLFREISRLTGVRYYRDQSDRPMPPAEPSVLRLDEVSRTACEELLQAVRQGSLRDMNRIVKEIREEAPEIASGLDRLVRRYDYYKLIELLIRQLKGEYDE